MTHGVQPQAGAAAGFTLLELLVVLAILALAAAIALPTLTSPSDGVRLRSAAGEIAAALRAARAAGGFASSPTAPRRAATLCFAWAIGGCACAWTG
jgi:general secretion pathway protein H